MKKLKQRIDGGSSKGKKGRTIRINGVESTTLQSNQSYWEFLIIDSGADKHLIVITKDGAWIHTDTYGPIKCEGFNNTSIKLELGVAETLVVTEEGVPVILEARQAVIYESEVANSLIDPSALAEAGGLVDIDFQESEGTFKRGNHTIKFKPNDGGIGFSSRRPTETERKQIERIPISTANYNKQKFMKKTKIRKLSTKVARKRNTREHSDEARAKAQHQKQSSQQTKARAQR
jgi:hypothetical protein